MMLNVKDLHVRYGSVEAIKGVSLEISEGEIIAVIGNNGAGKTTTMATIMGLITASTGEILFSNGDAQVDIRKMPAHKVANMGISMVPEGRQILSKLTVRENLEIGGYLRKDKDGIFADIARLYLLFPVLKEREKQRGGTLSGGEQQMLAIARSLMSNPRLLLMDEPSWGLAPLIVERLFEVIREINDDKTTIMLNEQNAGKALEVSHRGYVLATGRIVLEGTSKSLIKNDTVIKAYLGG